MKPRGPLLGRIIAMAIIAGAIALSVGAYRQSQTSVSSDDASIDADVVHIAAAVAGRIAALRVTENDLVKAGDELFHLDPTPYQLAAEQAESELAIARGLLETRKRSIAVETTNATVATQQIAHAEENHALAARTVERLRPLAAKSYIPYQQFDQARVAEADTATALAQARQAQIASQQAIGTLDVETATVRAREAALAIARRALEQTVVRAPHDGRVTGLSVLSGEIVAPGQSLFTLIATDAWFVSANIREGDLGAIQTGACVTAYSLIDRRQPIKGVVEGIGWGVLDDGRIGLPRALPYVPRSMNWVRVAQRFPVRIRLIDPPEPLMRAGASAVVEIGYGASCR